jgi:hypothetical protein
MEFSLVLEVLKINSYQGIKQRLESNYHLKKYSVPFGYLYITFHLYIPSDIFSSLRCPNRTLVYAASCAVIRSEEAGVEKYS